jgi:adenosylcobinamide-GDP ribazoletransferase
VKHALRRVLVALQFLTRVPLPRGLGFEPAWLQQSLRHFPLVGALVGAVAAGVLCGAMTLFPPAVAVGLALAATLWLTGGLHEDGLADTADALFGAASRERALEIMKDSRIGSYGALALVMTLGLKAAALVALLDVDRDRPLVTAAALVWAHAASRMAPLWVMQRLPYAGDPAQAKARPLTVAPGGASLAVAAGWLAVIAVALAMVSGEALPLAAAASAGVVVMLLCVRRLRRRLGGFTGDTLGAAQQWVELASLLAWLAAVRALHG